MLKFLIFYFFDNNNILSVTLAYKVILSVAYKKLVFSYIYNILYWSEYILSKGLILFTLDSKYESDFYFLKIRQLSEAELYL